jgi:Anaphase-promoting complex subunit 4 WD40 domain/WD domain, G-beta repeat
MISIGESLWISMNNVIFEIVNRKPSTFLRGHQHRITALASIGQWIVSADMSGTLKWWNVSGQLKGTFETGVGITALVSAAENKSDVIVFFEDRSVARFRLPEPNSTHISTPWSAVALTDSEIALATPRGLSHIPYSLEDKPSASDITKFDSPAYALAPIGTDGARWVTVSNDGIIRARGPNRDVEILVRTHSRVVALAVSPQAEYLAFATLEGELCLYSLAYHAVISSVRDTRVTALAFSENGLHLVSLRTDSTVRFHSSQDGAETARSEFLLGQPVTARFINGTLYVGCENGDVLRFEGTGASQVVRVEFPVRALAGTRDTIFVGDAAGNVTWMHGPTQETWPIGGGAIVSLAADTQRLRAFTAFGMLHSISLEQ